jgi:hypothetical protein
MQTGMKEARWVSINSLIAILVSGLEHKIANEVLHLEQDEAPEQESNANAHRAEIEFTDIALLSRTTAATLAWAKPE